MALGEVGRGAFAGPVRHLYIHVPFCRAKCDYCDFASRAVGAEPDQKVLDNFVDGVAAEWERERAAHDVRRLHTLYLGGGTPSVLGPDRLEHLLELFRPSLTPAAEITIEANPEDVSQAFAAWAGGAGARRQGDREAVRVSLGVQSFSRELRHAVGRRALADPGDAFARLRGSGVRNVSVDLMYGLPGQGLGDLDVEIGTVLALRPEHISWYELQVVPGTTLARRLEPGAMRQGDAAEQVPSSRAGHEPPPVADERAVMYRRIVRALQAAGYAWYEVSTYALAGRRARHNVAYWRARPYIGLGPGAVSTVGGCRWTNTTDVAAWRAGLTAPAPLRETECLDAKTRVHERLMLAARHGGALPLSEVESELNEQAARSLAAAGLVSFRGGTIRVTRKGRYVADEVCVRLFRD